MSVPFEEVTDELYAAITSGTAQITRRVEIYESDGETPWGENDPSKIKEGQVTVNYGGDEERRSCDFTFGNTDGELDHSPRGFWYDKILKPFRGIRYERPESYETTVKVKLPLAFWRVRDSTSMEDEVAGVDALTHPYQPIEVVASHNSHWEEHDQAARLRASDSIGFWTGSNALDITWPASSFTAEAWVRPRGQGGVNKTLFRLGNFSLGLAGANNSVFVRTYKGTSLGLHLFNDRIILREGLGKWYHILVTVVNNTLNGTSVHNLYVNGKYISSISTTGVVINTATTWASVGYDHSANSGWGDNDIADVALYPYELSEAEVFENYSVGTDNRVVTRSWDIQVGEFMIDLIDSQHFPKDVKVTGRDYTKKLTKVKFNETVAFSEGTDLDTIIEAVARNGGITKFRLGAGGFTLQSDASFDRTSERWAAIKDMCDSVGVEVYFDNQGYLVTRPFRDPSTSPTVITFQVGRDGNLNTYSYSSNDSQIYNKIIVTGENPDDLEEGLLYSGMAANTNEASPTSIQNIGERTHFHSSALFTSDLQCLEFARQLLKVNALEEFNFNFTSLVFAWLDVGEIIRVQVDESPDVIPERYLLSSLTIPFTLSTMSGTGKRIVIIEDPGFDPGDPGIPFDGGNRPPVFIEPDDPGWGPGIPFGWRA